MNLHILMVEDDPADAYRLEYELERAGLSFQAQRIETREAFMKALEQGPPDLVLSDHGLPSFDGFAALDLVQKKCPKVPFIFVTGSNDQATIVQMLEEGATGYVSKNQLSDLIPTVRQALGSSNQGKASSATVPHPGGSEISNPHRTPPVEAPIQQASICPHCQMVCDQEGTLIEIGAYFSQHTDAVISLSVCPRCKLARSENRPV